MNYGEIVRVGMFVLDDNISEYIHLGFAALFFISLSFTSIFLFTKSDSVVLGKEKKIRNAVYRGCGKE
jgi:hypothetical protein